MDHLTTIGGAQYLNLLRTIIPVFEQIDAQSTPKNTKKGRGEAASNDIYGQTKIYMILTISSIDLRSEWSSVGCPAHAFG